MFFKETCLVVVCSLACLMSFSTGLGIDRSIGRPGGLSATQVATAEIRTMVTSVKAATELRMGRQFTRFMPISYRSQVVAGINYFVKVFVGGASFIHLRIHKTLRGQVELAAYQAEMSRAAEIVYF